MILSPERVGSYLRALRSGLEALAPNDDFVPLAEALNHLDALAPSVSGEVLAPAEVHDGCGLPALPWLSRVTAEQQVALQGQDETDTADDEIRRATRLDSALGARLRDRRQLHRFLRENTILPGSRIMSAARRLSPTLDFTVTYDQIGADGLWTRLRVDVTGPAGKRLGPLKAFDDGSAVTEEGVLHLLARHARTPLLGLPGQLTLGLGATITRISRCHIGPFWFPGVRRSPRAPDGLERGLILHLSSEILGRDVRQSRHVDPLVKAQQPPEGMGLYRQRRFAATGGLVRPLQRWGDALGMDLVITRFG